MRDLFVSPFHRLLSQNPNAPMENSPVLTDLAFWKRKCVTDIEIAEMGKTKDLSAPLKEHLRKHPDAAETNSCVITGNVSTTDLFVTGSGIAERYFYYQLISKLIRKRISFLMSWLHLGSFKRFEF